MNEYKQAWMPGKGRTITDYFVQDNPGWFLIGVLYYEKKPASDHTHMRFSSWRIDIKLGTATTYDSFDIPNGCFKVRPTI
jgi:hypothetical protein